jgi:hypothetical protein
VEHEAMSGIKRLLDTMLEEVYNLTNNGWAEDKAIRHVAAKYDVSDWELAYYLLGV